MQRGAGSSMAARRRFPNLCNWTARSAAAGAGRQRQRSSPRPHTAATCCTLMPSCTAGSPAGAGAGRHGPPLLALPPPRLPSRSPSAVLTFHTCIHPRPKPHRLPPPPPAPPTMCAVHHGRGPPHQPRLYCDPRGAQRRPGAVPQKAGAAGGRACAGWWLCCGVVVIGRVGRLVVLPLKKLEVQGGRALAVGCGCAGRSLQLGVVGSRF